MKWLIGIIICVAFIYFHFFSNQPPENRQHLIFGNPPKSVLDSMLLVRQICENIEPKEFMNCYVRSRDSTLHFMGELAGRVDTVSVSNKVFKNMTKGDAQKLLSTLKFLNRNFIAGIVHDTSIGFWLYTYREDMYYNTTTTIRSIYIWDTPEDTLSTAFMYHFKILDRKSRMVLLSHNYVPYKQFSK